MHTAERLYFNHFENGVVEGPYGGREFALKYGWESRLRRHGALAFKPVFYGTGNGQRVGAKMNSARIAGNDPKSELSPDQIRRWFDSYRVKEEAKRLIRVAKAKARIEDCRAASTQINKGA